MESISLSRRFPAPAERVYRAWNDEGEHAAFTGSPAKFGEGGAFSAWDGYIEGRTLEAQAGRRLLQTWRTSDFPEDSPDSRVEIHFESVAGGCRVTIHHTDIPEGQGEEYRQGWEDYYFTPLAVWLARV